MDRRFSNATSSLASAALKFRTALARYWRTVLGDQGYRPELHYMRGPGPKWREAYTAQLVLMGAESTNVYARRYGSQHKADAADRQTREDKSAEIGRARAA